MSEASAPLLRCAGCGQKRDLAAFAPSSISESTPPDRIHRMRDHDLAGSTYLCPCGHYTVIEEQTRGHRAT